MSTNLSPVVCEDLDDVGAAAFDGVRRRPVVAINDEGQLVVCCRRTAAKNGWKLEGSMFQRDRKPAENPKRRRTDHMDAVMVPKKHLARVRDAVESTLGELLE